MVLLGYLQTAIVGRFGHAQLLLYLHPINTSSNQRLYLVCLLHSLWDTSFVFTLCLRYRRILKKIASLSIPIIAKYLALASSLMVLPKYLCVGVANLTSPSGKYVRCEFGYSMSSMSGIGLCKSRTGETYDFMMSM